MYLSELIAGLTGASMIGRDVEVSGLAYDSRCVKPGDVFVAVRGFHRDGLDFAGEAVERGAAAIVAERGAEGLEVPQVLVGNCRAALAVLADAFYGHPTGDLKLIGITGTNGKTTASFLAESILRKAGLKTGLIGTVECRVGDEVRPVVRTTPEAPDLQRTFREMVDRGVEAAVIEVSSHALDLHRVDGCEFDVGVFTNLSRDHLDYHRSLESYFGAKKSLFEREGIFGVINADDEFGARIIEDMGRDCLSYGIKGKVDLYAVNISADASGSRFTAVGPFGEFEVGLKLPGSFNVYNALAAIGAALALDLPKEAMVEGLESVTGVPGRFERIDAGQDGTVIVDYAHTPDGLEKALSAARELSERRVICVFGCGGDRDRTKRPLMGEVAARLADHTVVTSDNPRSEEPASIIEEIERGIRGVPGASYEIVEDRREAIKRAIAGAGKGDVVLIAGKGHETGQIFADKVIPFDDRRVAEEVAKELLRC